MKDYELIVGVLKQRGIEYEVTVLKNCVYVETIAPNPVAMEFTLYGVLEELYTVVKVGA